MYLKDEERMLSQLFQAEKNHNNSQPSYLKNLKKLQNNMYCAVNDK
jgi:hypothetical protein